MSTEISQDDDAFVTDSERRRAEGGLLVVGIGASAGGIKALKDFFAQVPADSGMAYVVILHLSPNHDSRLAELLQLTTSIPVTQVTDRARVEPNHVYVIPPNQSLAMNDGHLALSEIKHIEERRAPVDIFFRTLAESHGARAVCVVLSGTGANGSMGMKRVKERGGLCIVQDPAEAEYSDMPRNSLATNLVDDVLPVAEIPGKIIAYKEYLAQLHPPAELLSPAGTDEQSLRDILTQLRVRTGHDFTNYKRSTLLRRLERRVGVHGLSDLPAYTRYLREHPEETQALLKDLLISVTNFFRDRESFEALEQHIIPKLFAHKGPHDQVRVWVAGCATGEEAYSIAMLLSEYSAFAVNAPNLQIFATDLDEDAVARAREGLYTINDAADVSAERLRNFFVKEQDGYRVRRELREMVLFAVHNLVKDPPFSHLDLITCRNLLIYLNRTAQARVLDTMHFALNPGGHLFLGSSESVDGADDVFAAIEKEHRIYQSRAVSPRLAFHVPDMLPASRLDRPPREDPALEKRTYERFTSADMHQRLLERYAPPSVVVNEIYDVVHMSERAGRYMQIGGGEPSHNLLHILRPELRLDLRTALYQAMQQRANVEARGITVQMEGRAVTLNLIVRPVLGTDDAARGFILVLFEETGAAPGAAEAAEEETVSALQPIAYQLEEELVRVKTQLRVIVEQHELQQEELKASNEELQAMNEELRSSAEELETSKEELQSINEELTTVNQELKIKIEEISLSNDDFQNLIDSTDIATVFLERSLRVKLFTPSAREIFNLILSDVGRPLSDITGKLIYEDLLRDIEKVQDRLHTVEREVATSDGRWYMMRLLPYRTKEDRINGVVLTFFDVTKRKQTEEQLRLGEERLRLMMESVADYAIITLNAEGIVESWNVGAQRIFGYREDEAVGQNFALIFTLEDREQEIPVEEMRRAREDNSVAYERWHMRRDSSRFYASGVTSSLRGNGGATIGYVKILRDLTEQRHAQEQLSRAHDELEGKVAGRTRELGEANQMLRTEIVERKQVEVARGKLLRKLVTTQEDERRRVARDLHDHLGQQVTALRLKISALKDGREHDKISAAQVEEALALAGRLDREVDFLAWELRPAALDDLGLSVALANYVREWSRHFNTPAEFHTSLNEADRWPVEIETNLYRIGQEALNNIYKHANANRVEVILERRDDYVVLIIEDDGAGFDSQEALNLDSSRKAEGGLGLVSMRERAALVGGTLQIESAPGGGTTIFVRVPLATA